MALRSIASLSISFGLVSIPVKVYSATNASAALRFKLLSRGGERVRREYVADRESAPAVSESAAGAATSAMPGRSAGVAASRGAAAPSPSPWPAGQSSTMPSPPERQSKAAPPSDDAAALRDRFAIGRQEDDAAPASDDPTPRSADDGAEPDVDDELDIPPRGTALRPAEMLKAYEFEKGRFVTFTAAELKALGEASRPTIDIVSFVPEHSVDPIYFDKAYYLAPDKPGGKPYSLLHAAMRASGRSALARWAWRAKEYVVQIRPVGAGFVLQQLLYADEVRSIDELNIELSEVGAAELDLALRLIGQIGADGYDPHAFVDEEKQRILAAVERKIAGRKVIATPVSAPAMPSAQVIDLVAALRASLGALAAAPCGGARTTPARGASAEVRERKPARRAAKKAAAPAAPAAPAATAAPAAPRRRGRQSSS